MYPSLYYAFKDLFGINIPFLKMIQSFGFFVAVSFILAAYLLSKELKRKEQEGLLSTFTRRVLIGQKATTGEYIFSAVIGFIVGYKLYTLRLTSVPLRKIRRAFYCRHRAA